MDVRFSTEQEALSDSVAQVVDRLAPNAVGQLDDRYRAAKLGGAVAESGWWELRADRGDGEPLASAVEVAIVAEQLASGSADVAFLGPTLAAELRRRAGAPPASGVETVLFSSDLAALARVDSQGLHGDEIAIDAAGATAALVLLADGDDELVLSSVEVRAEQDHLDLTRCSARPQAGPVSTVEGQQRPLTVDDLAAWTALALSVTSADLVGTMAGAVDLARAYAVDRRQYTVAIGSFQAVQHMLADGLVATEGSRSSALYAAWAVDALPAEEAVAAAAMAKAYSSRAARQVCEMAIQVHGGIGNTWECMAHVQLRRALSSADIAGGVGPNLDRILCHNGVAHGGLVRSGIGGDDGLR